MNRHRQPSDPAAGSAVEIAPLVVADASALAEAAAEWTAARIATAVAERGVCYLALAGGETPRGCYQRLARPPYRQEVPWPKVFVYWSDERRVPLDDPASNFAMAKAALLDHVAIPPAQIFPLVGDPTSTIRQVPADGSRPRFDLIHLGMGEDGHTASLFPDRAEAEERKALVIAVDDAPKPPLQRLSFTLPLINAARAVLFMVQGTGKREAVARVLRRDPSLPASRVQPADGELQFIVDREAFGR
jgi:6-phosphogluconolactonase